MLKTEEIYYSYKNKNEVYYLTDTEELKVLKSKNEFIKTLSQDQIEKFSRLEIDFFAYKVALIKEIINYSISFCD